MAENLVVVASFMMLCFVALLSTRLTFQSVAVAAATNIMIFFATVEAWSLSVCRCSVGLTPMAGSCDGFISCVVVGSFSSGNIPKGVGQVIISSIVSDLGLGIFCLLVNFLC